MNEKLSNSFHDHSDIEKWKRENPVEIPLDVMERITKRRAEVAGPNLTERRWKELNDEHRRMMEGNADEDLYYQLAFYRGRTGQGDDGVKIKIHQLEQALLDCWCGSGKKYARCHGK